MTASPLSNLCDEYARWNAAQGLSLGSADEHYFDESLTAEQREWVRDFGRRWDGAAEEEAERVRVHRSEKPLHVDSDGMSGSDTYVGTFSSPSFLALRRAVRESNPGRIPIYSDYDCTGRVCYQSCKVLRVYKHEDGDITFLVEIYTARDV